MADGDDERGRSAEVVSPLLQAAYRHHWDAVETIRAETGIADVFEAAVVGDTAALYDFVTADPDAVHARTPDGFAALHLAAYFAHPAAVHVLLQAGADPDVASEGEGHERPLHAAVAGRDAACVRHLLEAGADVSVHQAGGYTPLLAAARHGDEAIVRLLLDHGADPRIPADDGQTPWDVADPAVRDLLADADDG